MTKKAILSLAIVAITTTTASFAQASPDSDKWAKTYFAGLNAQKRGDLQGADDLFANALRQAEKFDKRDPRLMVSLKASADCLAEQNKVAEAEALYNKRVKAYEDAFGADYPRVADACVDLGKLFLEHGECAKATELYKRALRIYEARYGMNNARVNEVLGDLGQLCVYQGNFADASRYYSEAIAVGAKNGRNYPNMKDEYAATLEAEGNTKEALKYLPDSYFPGPTLAP